MVIFLLNIIKRCFSLTLIMQNILCTTLLPNFYNFKLQDSWSYMHVFTSRAENSVDPDQLAS